MNVSLLANGCFIIGRVMIGGTPYRCLYDPSGNPLDASLEEGQNTVDRQVWERLRSIGRKWAAPRSKFARVA